MKVSVCITVFNEEKSISDLLLSLLNQTKKPAEIIIVDAASVDKTVRIIRHWQKKDKRIRLLVQQCSRSEGRNIAVELAKNDIIAMTDAGCIAHKNWLERLISPFKHKEVGIVAGFYKMVGESPFQKAAAIFLGITPSKFDINFLPSTRSIAFRKEVYERIGGFSEELTETAEDTIFSYQAINLGINFARVKTAIVEWRMPEKLEQFVEKMYSYAKGDAQSRVWWHPGKGLASHNIKVLLIFTRYLTGLIILILSNNKPVILLILLALLILYLLWSFRKVYLETEDWKAGLWGIVLQFSADFAVMGGFLSGIIKK